MKRLTSSTKLLDWVNHFLAEDPIANLTINFPLWHFCLSPGMLFFLSSFLPSPTQALPKFYFITCTSNCYNALKPMGGEAEMTSSQILVSSNQVRGSQSSSPRFKKHTLILLLQYDCQEQQLINLSHQRAPTLLPNGKCTPSIRKADNYIHIIMYILSGLNFSQLVLIHVQISTTCWWGTELH